MGNKIPEERKVRDVEKLKRGWEERKKELRGEVFRCRKSH